MTTTGTSGEDGHRGMFRVPEADRYQSSDPRLRSSRADGNNGVFEFDSPTSPGWKLYALVSDGGGWEHVSVHARRATASTLQTRTPSWAEMVYVKDVFWSADATVVQYHPKKSAYVNKHAHVLHLWRPIGVDLPTPPIEFV